MAMAIIISGYMGVNPPGFAAEVVALAFGLAASSIFPALMLGDLDHAPDGAGAVVGMLAGLATTLGVYLLV